MKIALCQPACIDNDARANASSIINIMEKKNADLFIFPELFLTGYGDIDYKKMKKDVTDEFENILQETKRTDKAVIFGSPTYEEDKIYNSAVFIHNDIKEYRKLNLAHFQFFHENYIFTPGTKPIMIKYKKFTFGLSICYDLFFPELFKYYAMNGADVNVCISASPVTSKKAFDHVLPARSVEDTAYTIYVNNAGISRSFEFAGGSRCISPTGDDIAYVKDNEYVTVTDIFASEIQYARTLRPTLSDTRNDIVWEKERY